VRNQVQKEIEEMKDTESRHAREIQTESKRMERLLNKRSLLLQKQEECTQKIRELGSLPANVEKYKDMVKKELLDQLDKVRLHFLVLRVGVGPMAVVLTRVNDFIIN
jgi:hypothetical protein